MPAVALAEVVDRLRAAGCVFAEDEAALLIGAADSPEELAALLERRTAGVPLEHVLGWVEFGGRRFAVEAGVFVPRRRTELLARQAINCAPPNAVVVELCCGCGAVGAVVAAAVAGAQVHAADLDPVATRCAARNLAAVGGRTYTGDLYDPLPHELRGRVDVLIANAPYVPSAAVALMPPEARLHEPRPALDGGVDGLDVLRRVIADAPQWLTAGGTVLVECGAAQVDALVAAMQAAGLRPTVMSGSEELNATVVSGALGS